MTFHSKPKISYPGHAKNRLGLTKSDYEGALSTLCAGCGHDSVTAAIVQSFFELGIEPYQVGKMSGIGCSSKTPGYFLNRAHGFNAVHGRMLTVTTGAAAANHKMKYLGVSGDGDSASIGIGHLIHGMRRNVNMLYIVENNGVYGLTKGQFSAMAEKGSWSKSGIENSDIGIDLCQLALQLGCGYIARGFSGDKAQLVPLIKAGLHYRGFSIIDVISPCVTFNNHQESTRSYQHAYQKSYHLSVADFIESHDEIQVSYSPGNEEAVTLHNGSTIRLSKLAKDFKPKDRSSIRLFMEDANKQGKILTGLLYLGKESKDLKESLSLPAIPLRDIPYSKLCPGGVKLEELNKEMRP